MTDQIGSTDTLGLHHPVDRTVRDRARATVRRHALDDQDLDELLAALGLDDAARGDT